MRRHVHKSGEEKKVARERIQGLFRQADESFKERPDLSNRYVGLARRIAMKYKVRIGSDLKKKFCKHCHTFLRPGSNCRVRLNEGKVVYYCLACKRFMRFPKKIS